MKPLLPTIILLSGLGFASLPSLNANSIRLTASVPFSFEAYGKSMQSGDYVLREPQLQSQPFEIWSKSSGQTIFLPARKASQASSAATSSEVSNRLLFVRVNDHYVLTQVCSEVEGCSIVSLSRSAREAMANAGPDRIASIEIRLRPTA